MGLSRQCGGSSDSEPASALERPSLKTLPAEATEMVEPAKAVATNSDGVSSIPRFLTVGEN